MKLRTKIYFRLKNYPYNMTNERMVEIPFILQNIPKEKSIKILDIGCDESILPIMLSSYGYNVHGIDINNYDFDHINFKFHKGNLKDYDKFAKIKYDCIISMSTIEHIGLGYYGKDDFSQKEAFQKVLGLLKDDGVFILTIPYGKYSINKLQIVYDEKLLNSYLEDFKIIKSEYYRSFLGKWSPCSKEILIDIPSHEETNAICCMVLMKNEHKST